MSTPDVATIGPALDGPPSMLSVAFDLATVGYATHEHFATGTASSFTAASAWEPDGRWQVKPDAQADFTTRLVVIGPVDRARANGTVIVEWLNVTGGLDVPALWMPTQRHLVREGFTWVGVSVQRVGIEGGGVMPGLGLHQMDPARYGDLVHPGDAFSFDVFTQVARGVRTLLTERYGVPVEWMLAAGASQSAFHLTTYINAVDADAAAFDGFLLQGRAGASMPIGGWDQGAETPAGEAAMAERRMQLVGRDHIRSDARVPVLVVQSETDVFGSLAYLPARQPDGEHFRLWEVAGAAHCDSYFLGAAPHDSGALPIEQLAAMIGNAESTGIPTELPVNSGPQMHYVLQCAFAALDRWVRDGTAPPSAPRIEASENGDMVLDELGIARGGVRSPWVDAPLAVLSGLGQPGTMSSLFGTTRAFEPGVLDTRYPGGRADYIAEFERCTKEAVAGGFVLAVDAPEINALGAATWDLRTS